MADELGLLLGRRNPAEAPWWEPKPQREGLSDYSWNNGRDAAAVKGAAIAEREKKYPGPSLLLLSNFLPVFSVGGAQAPGNSLQKSGPLKCRTQSQLTSPTGLLPHNL